MSDTKPKMFVSHLDMDTLTPHSCRMGCYSMSQDYAAIEFGLYCFCVSADSSYYTIKKDDSECQQLSCSGDASISCGSSENTIIYDITNMVPSNLENTENVNN